MARRYILSSTSTPERRSNANKSLLEDLKEKVKKTTSGDKDKKKEKEKEEQDKDNLKENDKEKEKGTQSEQSTSSKELQKPSNANNDSAKSTTESKTTSSGDNQAQSNSGNSNNDNNINNNNNNNDRNNNNDNDKEEDDYHKTEGEQKKEGDDAESKFTGDAASGAYDRTAEQEEAPSGRLGFYLLVTVGLGVLIVMPLTTLYAKGLEQRHWPVVNAQIMAMNTENNIQKVTYQYGVIYGDYLHVVERTQERWSYPLLDRINDTALPDDIRPGAVTLVRFHPNNPALSIFRPGRFAKWNLSFKKHHLDGNLIVKKPLSQISEREGQAALWLNFPGGRQA